ncbi:MAG: glycosyltransferase involved in cell wall biosynthesis [Verrucomicrobiales bacterium]|jgi:glycosyltransferase involved in cell wall biosynthesis
MKMCQAMSKLGHDVRLLTLSRPAFEEPGVEDVFAHYGVERRFELEKLPFPGFPGRQLIYAFSAWRQARQWKPDLIYGRYFPAMAMVGLAGWPVAWESHERVWDRSGMAKRLAKRLFASRGFRKLVVISEALKSMYVEAEMIEAERIEVAHDAADPATIEIKAHEGFRVGYIGGVYPGRGIELVLECAVRLPDVEFHFVGGTAPDLQKLPGITELSANVICHGYQPPDLVPEMRASFDVLLAPYQRKVAVWGGNGDTSAFMSPLKIFEYMASGRPMICSDLPVLREVLNDKNALLVQPEDVDGWVTAIAQLRDNRELGAKIAESALADFEENYTWDKRAERVLTACA